MTALVTERDTRRLFALVPDDVYRSFKMEVNISSAGRLRAEARLWVSEADGSVSFTASSIEGLIRKVEAYFTPRLP